MISQSDGASGLGHKKNFIYNLVLVYWLTEMSSPGADPISQNNNICKQINVNAGG